MRKISILLSLLFIMNSGFSQSDNSKLLADWERAKAYTKEYLDAMPDDGYSLKPTPEMRTFSEQMLHLAEANYGLSSMASGKASPVKFGELEKQADKSKAATVKAVMDSYDFVIDGLKSMNATTSAESIDVFGNKITKGEAFVKAFEHQTHHRGQTTVYLRMKGVKAPQEKLF